MHAPGPSPLKLHRLTQALALCGLLGGCLYDLIEEEEDGVEIAPSPETGKVLLSEAKWMTRLSEEQYQVLRQGRTERAFSGDYWKHEQRGFYLCAACRQPLYHSRDKFDSGDGRPSFVRAIDGDAIEAGHILSFGTVRVEIRCSRCRSHLGYAYPEGPATSGIRHSLNSLALRFETRGEMSRRLRHERRAQRAMSRR